MRILLTRERRIWLKPDRMTAYNISVDEGGSRSVQLEVSPGKTGESSGKLPNL